MHGVAGDAGDLLWQHIPVRAQHAGAQLEESVHLQALAKLVGHVVGAKRVRDEVDQRIFTRVAVRHALSFDFRGGNVRLAKVHIIDLADLVAGAVEHIHSLVDAGQKAHGSSLL